MQSIDCFVEQQQSLIVRVLNDLKIYKNRDDYMQVARISVWQSIPDFDESRGELDMFIYSRVKYALIRAMTKANKIEQFEFATDDKELYVIADHQIDFEGDERIPEWFELLTEEDRRLLRMIYFEEKTTMEVAVYFGISYEALKKRRQRLLKKLKNIVPRKL